MVVRWFFDRAGLLDTALAHNRWIHAYRTELFSVGAAYRASVYRALCSGRYRTIKVVRHPYRRAVSAFLVLGERGAIGPEEHWIKAYWRTIDSWRLARGKDPAAGVSFEEHLKFLKAFQGHPHLDNHLRPQHVLNEQRVIDEIVPIERFRVWAETAELPSSTLNAWPAHRTQTHHHRADDAETGALGQWPERARVVRGLYASGRFPDVDAFINERTLPHLASIYAADVAAYGARYGLTATTRRSSAA